MIDYLNEEGFNTFRISHPTKQTKYSMSKKYRFAYVEHGSVKAETPKGTFEAFPGEMLFLPIDFDYVLHYNAGDKGKCYGWCLMTRFFMGVNRWDYAPQVITATPEIIDAIKDLPEDSADINFKINCSYVRRVFTFLEIAQKHLAESDASGAEITEKAIDYMQNNQRYSVLDVARYCNVSESYLFKLFNKHVAMSPVKMKQKIQAEKGEKLLEITNLTIDEIANRVGFDSTAHFRKVFESRFFCSPKEYRKKLKLNK